MPRPRPQSITIQLPPRAGVRPRPTGTPGPTGDCTPNIIGLGWCHYPEASRIIESVGDEGVSTYIPRAETEGGEARNCLTADIEFTLTDGVIAAEQSGLYEFGLLGEACSCIPTWEVIWTRTQEHETNNNHFAVLLNGNVLCIYAATDLLNGSSSAAEHILGFWTISATCGGQTYGPITMTLSGTGAPD